VTVPRIEPFGTVWCTYVALVLDLASGSAFELVAGRRWKGGGGGNTSMRWGGDGDVMWQMTRSHGGHSGCRCGRTLL